MLTESDKEIALEHELLRITRNKRFDVLIDLSRNKFERDETDRFPWIWPVANHKCELQ